MKTEKGLLKMKLVCMNCNEINTTEHLIGGCPKCNNKEPEKFANIGISHSGVGYFRIPTFRRKILENNLNITRKG